MATRRSTRQRRQTSAKLVYLRGDRALDAIDLGIEKLSGADDTSSQELVDRLEAMQRQRSAVQQENLPPRKKMRMDFSKNVVVTLGSNTTTVPEDLLRARSIWLASRIKDGENGSPSYIKEDVRPNTVAVEPMFSAYLQLLKSDEVALDPEYRPPRRLNILQRLYRLCEYYQDPTSMNLVMSEMVETLHDVTDSGEVSAVIGHIYTRRRPGHPLRRMLVDHGCDFWSMSDYSVHVDFLNEAFAELIRRRDESIHKAVRLPPAEAVKNYLVPE